jgi:Protein of unknown function (DUF3108)
MRRIVFLPVLLSLAIPLGSPRAAWAADPIHVHYAVHGSVLGIDTTVAAVRADFLVLPDTYDVRLDFRTTGLVSSIVSANSDSRAVGHFERGGTAAPLQFTSAGQRDGDPRRTLIAYDHGDPVIRTLVPLVENLRDPVPPAQTPGTMDPMSAMAELVHAVNNGERCDGRVTTFDGRRLVSFTSRTAGMQSLPRTDSSAYAGPALRCDVVSQQLAGFKHDNDEPRMRHPQAASAWFARLSPDGPLVLVRATFPAVFFGTVTMYLQPPGE